MNAGVVRIASVWRFDVPQFKTLLRENISRRDVRERDESRRCHDVRLREIHGSVLQALPASRQTRARFYNNSADACGGRGMQDINRRGGQCPRARGNRRLARDLMKRRLAIRNVKCLRGTIQRNQDLFQELVIRRLRLRIPLKRCFLSVHLPLCIRNFVERSALSRKMKREFLRQL